MTNTETMEQIFEEYRKSDKYAPENVQLSKDVTIYVDRGCFERDEPTSRMFFCFKVNNVDVTHVRDEVITNLLSEEFFTKVREAIQKKTIVIDGITYRLVKEDL